MPYIQYQVLPPVELLVRWVPGIIVCSMSYVIDVSYAYNVQGSFYWWRSRFHPYCNFLLHFDFSFLSYQQAQSLAQRIASIEYTPKISLSSNSSGFIFKTVICKRISHQEADSLHPLRIRKLEASPSDSLPLALINNGRTTTIIRW